MKEQRKFSRPGLPWRRSGAPQIVASVLLTGLALGGLGLTVRALYFSRPQSFVGVVEPANRVDLTFQTSGVISFLDVKPGQHVVAGQVLAKENNTVAQLQVQAAEAAVAADEANLQALQAPSLGAALQVQLSLELQKAEEQLTGAKQQLTTMESVNAADTSTVKALLTSDQQALQQDQSDFRAACPYGLVVPPDFALSGSTPSPAPSGSGASATGVTTSTAVAQYVECQRLSDRISSDQRAVEVDQGQVAVDSQIVQESTDSAQTSIQLAETSVGIANATTAVAAAPASPATIALAQAQLAKDQAQLAIEQNTLTNTTLTAPTSGVVIGVAGAMGDAVSSQGVISYASLSQPAAPAGASFSLFPAQPSGGNSSSAQGFQPVVTLAADSQWDAVAQVPQSEVISVQPGQRGTVNIPGEAHGPIPATVVQVDPSPITESGATYYDVVYSLDPPSYEILPGMVVSVSIS